MRGLLPTAITILLVSTTAIRAGEPFVLACAPALPMYCANIHVGCAGRSRVAAKPFILHISDVRARIEDSDAEHTGRATHDRTAMIVRKASGQDWIRIEIIGTGHPAPYAQRIYQRGQPLMMRGRCWPETHPEHAEIAAEVRRSAHP